MGCGASSASKYAAVGEPTVWETYRDRLPGTLRDDGALARAARLVPPMLARMEAALRDERRAMAQELARHQRRAKLFEASKVGFAEALGAVRAVGAMLAPPELLCDEDDAARIAKASVRQRLTEATAAVAGSGESAKRQSLLRHRAANLSFAREFCDRIQCCDAAEIRTLHDDAQKELAAAASICDRLSGVFAAAAGAKHRWLRAHGVRLFAEDPINCALFSDEERAQFAREDQITERSLRDARGQTSRAKDARRSRALARGILWVIREVGGVPPTPERLAAVKLAVETEILQTEEELLQLRGLCGVEKYRTALATLHGSAATLSALAERKAKRRQQGPTDTCVHQAVLAGQMQQSLAVVAQYQGAKHLKRRHRRALRAAEESVRTCEELLEQPYGGVAAFLHSAMEATQADMEAAAQAIAGARAQMVERKRFKQHWEVARGARAFASTVMQRQLLPLEDHVSLNFQIRVVGKKKAALRKLHKMQRVGAGFLPPVSPPLQRRLMVLGADGLVKADLITGSSDPYAVVYWNDERLAQTPVIKNSLAPKWGFPLPLPIPQPEGGKIRVEIFDHDTNGDHDFLGQAELTLKVDKDKGDDQLRLPVQKITLTKGREKERAKAVVQGTLTLRLDDPTQDSVRDVVVVSAVGLRNADRLGTSDPYAVVLWDGHRCGQTHVVSNSLSPQWEMGIPVSVPPCGGTATVQVYDHDDVGSHDFLGEAEITIGPDGACRGTPADPLVMKRKTFILTPGRLKAKVKGKVNVLVENPAKQPPPTARRLVIEGAANLKNTDLMGNSDPYAKVFWNGTEIGKTNVAEDTLDPVWSDAQNGFEVFVPARGGALRVDVFDYDVGPNKDDLLGTVELRVGGDGVGGGKKMGLTPTKAVDLKDTKGNPAKGPAGLSRLSFRVEHPPLKRRLVVESARALPGMDASGTADPYARVVWLGEQLGRTAVIRGTVEPAWDKEFMLDIPERGSKMRVIVLDRDALSADDVIGEFELDIGGGAVGAGGVACLMRSAEHALGPPGQPELAPTSEGLYGYVRLRLEEPGLKRRLTVSRAAGLASTDRGGASDPYAVVTFDGEEMGKTGIVRDTVDPVWNATFDLVLPPDGAELVVEIFDYDETGGDDFNGRVTCRVGEEGADNTDETAGLMAWGWHDLTNKKGKPTKGRLELAIEAVKAAVTEEPTHRKSEIEDVLPVQVRMNVLSSEWDCWARHERNFEDELDESERRRPIIQLGLNVNSVTHSVDVNLSVVIEAYHVEDLSTHTEVELRTATEATLTTAVAYKAKKRQYQAAAGRLYALQCAADWLQARVAAMDRDTVLRQLFFSVDIDGDGELTRRELREAPFGARLSTHWVELDKNHDEGVEVEEWIRYFAELETTLGWTATLDLIVSLVWDAEVAAMLRHQTAVELLKKVTATATKAAKEDSKCQATAYFAGEEEKRAREAAKGQDGMSEASELWQAAVAKRDAAIEASEVAKQASYAAQAIVVETQAEVDLTQQFQETLKPLMELGTEGANDWKDFLRDFRHKSERRVEQEQEQLDSLASSLDMVTQATVTALHLRGGLGALDLLSGGGGNPIRVKRNELKVEASLAAVQTLACRSSRADRSANRSRLKVVDGARNLLGRLQQVNPLLYIDEMDERLTAAIQEEAWAATAVEDLALAKDNRRQAKREFYRASGAAAWAQDPHNSDFVEGPVAEKAQNEKALAAITWKDARKWAIGSLNAKQRAAAARQELRVLQGFEKEQPSRSTALVMLRELRHDARCWERDVALEVDLATESDEWLQRFCGLEGSLQVLSKEFMEKAEQERQARKLEEERLRKEAEARAKGEIGERSARAGQARALSQSEKKLKMLSEEPHVQLRRQVGEGDRVCLRDGCRMTGCLSKGEVGRVLIYERLPNRAKVQSEKTGRISWYSCEREVAYFGPLPPELIEAKRMEQELALKRLKEEQSEQRDIDAFKRQRALEMNAYDAQMEMNARLEKEAEARARARSQVTTRVRSQLKMELALCSEMITSSKPSHLRLTALQRRISSLDGALSGVEMVRICWLRATTSIDPSQYTQDHSVRSMAFFAAEILKEQEGAEVSERALLDMVQQTGLSTGEEAYNAAIEEMASCKGAVRFLQDTRLADGTTERRFMEAETQAGFAKYKARTMFRSCRETDETMLREAGRASIVRRIRSLIGLGVGTPPAMGRHAPDDLGGLLGLSRRPITPPLPPMYTPRLNHGNRPGKEPAKLAMVTFNSSKEPGEPMEAATAV